MSYGDRPPERAYELARPLWCPTCYQITPHWTDRIYLRCLGCDPPEPPLPADHMTADGGGRPNDAPAEGSRD